MPPEQIAALIVGGISGFLVGWRLEQKAFPHLQAWISRLGLIPHVRKGR